MAVLPLSVLSLTCEDPEAPPVRIRHLTMTPPVLTKTPPGACAEAGSATWASVHAGPPQNASMGAVLMLLPYVVAAWAWPAAPSATARIAPPAAIRLSPVTP